MCTWRQKIWGTLSLLLIFVPAARAQQQTEPPASTPEQAQAPIPAYRSPLASAAGEQDDLLADPQKYGPDTRSLAGAQDLTVGVPPMNHSYWQPHFDVNSTMDSNGLSGKNKTGWTTYSSLVGGVDLHRTSGQSDLMLSYVGGGTISSDGSIPNSFSQQFQFSDKFSWRRAAVSFLDQLSYLPESSFGYGGFGGAGLPGGGSIGLQNGIAPGQSILTTRGQRLTNSFITQVDTYLTGRTSLTFLGGYSLLHYFDNTILNYGDAIFQAGYNHQLTRKDTFAVFYRFNAYRYSGFNQSITDNSFQVSYGRRVTGKMAFQAAGGPDVAFMRVPVTSSSGSSGGTGGATANSTTRVYLSLSTSLTYQFQRTGLGLSYNHGLGGGSGVLAGSVADSVSGSVSRQLSRSVHGGLSLGYAHNNGVSVASGTPTNQSFGYFFGGANVSHSLGRTMNVSLSYQAQYQNSDSAFCAGVTCGTSLTRHTFSVGLGWRERPIPF